MSQKGFLSHTLSFQNIHYLIHIHNHIHFFFFFLQGIAYLSNTYAIGSKLFERQ